MKICVGYCDNREKTMHDLAWSLLYDYIEEEYGLSQDSITLAYNEHGKPYFLSHPDIHFSIAHSRGCVACAIHSAPIGIDLEMIRRVSDRVKTQMLDLPQGAEDREAIRRFTELESYVKYKGTALISEHRGKRYDEIKKTADSTCRFIDCSHLVREGYLLTLCIGRESEKTASPAAPLSASAWDRP